MMIESRVLRLTIDGCRDSFDASATLLPDSPKSQWPSSLAMLLVSVLACAKADLVPIADVAVDARDTTDLANVADSANLGHDARADDSSIGPEVNTTCPAPSLNLCTPHTAQPCDPVCQTGDCDWCTQKCSYAFDHVAAQPTCTSRGQKIFPQPCAVNSSGSSSQFDDCALGYICLAPIIGDNPTYCFALCASAADCPHSVDCGQRKLSPAGGLVAVCDPPYDQCGTDGTCCDPVAGSGCPANRSCLLVSPDPDSKHSRTVCEFAYGNGRNSSPCDSSRDCLVKNTCVSNTCRQICNSASPCPNSGICTSWGTEYGYCPN